MPRNVRNFWLELTVDGKKTDIATGPVSKDGGFFLTVKQRSESGIIRAMTVQGFCQDGRITLTAQTPNTVQTPIVVETKR